MRACVRACVCVHVSPVYVSPVIVPQHCCHHGGLTPEEPQERRWGQGSCTRLIQLKTLFRGKLRQSVNQHVTLSQEGRSRGEGEEEEEGRRRGGEGKEEGRRGRRGGGGGGEEGGWPFTQYEQMTPSS